MTPSPAFTEHYVEADGFHIRYLEGGQGEPFVVLHGAGGLRLSRSHELLAELYRVILFELPGFGQSAINTRSASIRHLATTMAEAVEHLGLERFTLMGNSFGGRLALWWAIQHPESIQALILAAPAAIRPEGLGPTGLPPAARAALLFAHPERQPPTPPTDPAVQEKQDALVQRLLGPPRDHELESRLCSLDTHTLVLFGTQDRMIPPEMGRIYRQLIPNCHFILLYDAAHALDADRPEAFVAVVEDFLARDEGFLVKNQPTLIHP